ncbi:MAG: PAS domain S-box protein [Deltaproteobacteria bacterium]|nr:PAS domain S-box protein [Deltaproteobacteria bacterium]
MIRRPILSCIIAAIAVFMAAVTAIFIYTSVHLKDKVIFRIVQQTELISELLTRSAIDTMSAGHHGKYDMILAYGNLIGVDEVGIFKLTGEEASFGEGDERESIAGAGFIRNIDENEKESFYKSVETMNSTGFFNRANRTYSRYVPLKSEGPCASCHHTEGEVLGVLKIRLSTESDFDLLGYMQKLLWILGLLVCLPAGALIAAAAVIREKNKIYSQLEESNGNLKSTYNELHETEYYLQMILDNSRVIIVTTDTQGRIVEFNKEAEALLEYTKDDVAGKDVLMLYESPQQRSELMNRGRPIDNEIWEVRNRDVRFKSKSGKVFHVSLTLSTMVNDEGRIIGTVGVGKDVSEQKMLQFKLLQSEKLAGIGTLASGIAHEINNPLAGILGMAEAAMDEDDAAMVKSHIKDIIEYTVNARNIVRELSAYSRSAQNSTESVADLAHAIDNALKMARHSAPSNEIDLRAEAGQDCVINASPVEMQQVFVNLIINAIHAIPGRGAVSVKCWREGNFIRATVEDTGSGIPEKNLTQIFDPFFTTKPVGMGTGLGLYVVYRIVTKYGGAIDVDSREGAGTTFYLKFPLAETAIA